MTKKGGVPLWTIAAAIGVVVLIAVVAVVLRSLDQHASDVTKPFNFTCFFGVVNISVYLQEKEISGSTCVF